MLLWDLPLPLHPRLQAQLLLQRTPLQQAVQGATSQRQRQQQRRRRHLQLPLGQGQQLQSLQQQQQVCHAAPVAHCCHRQLLQPLCGPLLLQAGPCLEWLPPQWRQRRLRVPSQQRLGLLLPLPGLLLCSAMPAAAE